MKIKNFKYLLILVIITLLSCGSEDSSTTSPPNKDDTFVKRMTALGFNLDYGKPTNSVGQELPDNYNPLGKKFSSYKTKYEIAAAGITYKLDGQDKEFVIFNDGSQMFNATEINFPYLPLFTSGSNYYEKPLHCFSGDIDGDGIEEVLTAVYENNNDFDLKLIVTTHTKSQTYHSIDQLGVMYDVANETVHGLPYDQYYTSDIEEDLHYKIDGVSGDIDGDGIDEIIIAIGHLIYFIDDKSTNYTIIKKIEIPEYDPNNVELLLIRLACGDLNEDGKEDVAASIGWKRSTYPFSKLKVYSYNDDPNATERIEETVSKKIQTIINGNTYNLELASCAIGDIDGDRKKEIVFAGDYSVNNTVQDNDYSIIIFDDYFTNFTPITTSNIVKTNRGSWSQHRSIPIKTFRPEGLNSYIEGSNTGATALQEYMLVYNKVYQLQTAGSVNTIVEKYTVDDFDKDLAVTGDVTGDGKDDVIIQRGGEIRIFGFNADSDWKMLHELDVDRTHYSSICTVNWDKDSEIVEYLGQHEILVTEPQIYAVLAAPPYNSAFNNTSLENMNTYIGFSDTTTESSTHTAGIDVGFSVGLHIETPLWGSAGQTEIKANFESSFNFTTSSISSVTYERGFQCPANEDHVILQAVPFDVYYYRIVSSPDSASSKKDSDNDGVIDEDAGIFTINIPRDPQVIPFERNRYNKIMRDLNMNEYVIGKDVLGHTIGNVSTYPDLIEKNNLYTEKKDAGFLCSSGLIQPSLNANGLQSMLISIDNGEAYGGGFELSASLEMETIGGGILFGIHAGFHYGYEYNIEYTDTTTVGTSISNIPDTITTDIYSIGLMTYREKLANDMEFIVVNYWHE